MLRHRTNCENVFINLLQIIIFSAIISDHETKKRLIGLRLHQRRDEYGHLYNMNFLMLVKSFGKVLSGCACILHLIYEIADQEQFIPPLIKVVISYL